ncbi:MAG: 23S rRNA (adenine(2503)-C(2))-methyltransferase RlmN [Verrucomicrobia bacterium]|nr:23S rRNA (adenine(2503)-C(2))-methyltransferase RlmN [Verrucomicrobiota bacterium]
MPLLPLLLDTPVAEWNLPPDQPWREKQIRAWILQRFVSSYDEMTDLSAPQRSSLASRFRLRAAEPARIQGSEDTTRKFLWKLGDSSFVESVLIPANLGKSGNRSTRLTLCVSSQVGCAYGCRFCASGLDGWRRNLTAAEIVGQVLEAARIAGRRPDNVVFMGMGEPLANLPNLLSAIDLLISPAGIGMGARHVTISTSGLAPQIEELAHHPLQFRLALSLHAASDEIRDKIMPVNRRYPLDQLLAACDTFIQARKKMIFFEYILLAGINDTPEQARLLAQHAKRLHAKVNLIPYNKVEGLPYERPEEDAIHLFCRTLLHAGVRATVRREKGNDIDAACGQLRLREEKTAPPAIRIES